MNNMNYNVMTPPDSMMGGEMITGKWINKLTGKTINVRNTIIDGDNLIIISDAGQITMDEFSRNYIQASDEIYDESGKVIGKEKLNFGPIEQPTMIQNNNKTSNQQVSKTPQENETTKLIKKMFSKIDSSPEISINIDWKNFPKEQLNTLINFLDVDINEISKYITKNYINTSSLSLLVKDFLDENLK